MFVIDTRRAASALVLAATVLAAAFVLGCSGDDAPPPCPRGQVWGGTRCEWFALNGYRTERISFQGARGLLLEGDITIPQADNADAFPAVLLLADRGAQDRHGHVRQQHELEFGKIVPIFDDLRDHLVAAGFVVLRYDTRFCFSGNGCDNDYPAPFNDTVYDDLVGDAEAAAAYLAGHANVLANDITVLGNGDGAQIGAVLDTPLRDLVMFGASYEPVDDDAAARLETSRGLLEQKGLSASEIDSQTAPQQQLVADLKDLRQGTLKGARIQAYSVTYWRQWLALGDEAKQRLPTAPYGVLQLHGTYDLSVTFEVANAFAKAMAAHHDHSYKLFPQLTHPLVRVVEPNVFKVTPADVASSLDQLLLDELTRWLYRATDGSGPADVAR